MTSVHDMTLRQGNTFRRRFRFKGLDGSPVDLRGSVVTVTIGETRKTSAEGTLGVPSPIAGEVLLLLTAADTRELPIGGIPYEMERAILDERTNQWDEATLVTGTIFVQRGINDER